MGNLTDLATVRQSITRLAAVSDDEIERLIAEASDAIEVWCNRSFGGTTFTEVYDTDGSGGLFLPNRPITSITSITTGWPNNPTVVDASTYRFNPTTGEVQGIGSSGTFWTDLYDYFSPFGGTGFQSVRVIYVGAYTTIPPAIAGWCLSLISRKAASLAIDPTVSSKTFGRVSYTVGNPAMSALINTDDMRLYSLYRNWEI